MTRIKGNLLFPKQSASIGVFLPAQLWGSGGVGAFWMVNYFVCMAGTEVTGTSTPALCDPTDRHSSLLFADSAPALCLLPWLGSPYPLYTHMPHLLQISDLPPRSSAPSTHIFWTPKTIPHLFSSFLLPPGVPDPQSLFFTPSLKSLPSHAHSPHSSFVLSPDKTLLSLSQSHRTGDQIFDFLQNQTGGTTRRLL